MFNTLANILNTPIMEQDRNTTILLLIVSVLLSFCSPGSLVKPLRQTYHSVSSTWMEMEEDFNEAMNDTIQAYSLTCSFVVGLLMSSLSILRSVLGFLWMACSESSRMLFKFLTSCWLELEDDFNRMMMETFFSGSPMGSSSPPLTPEQIEANRVAFIKRQLKGKTAVVKQLKSDKDRMQQEHARLNDLIGTLLTEDDKNRDLIADLRRTSKLQQEHLERKTRESSERENGLENLQRELETVRKNLSTTGTMNTNLQTRLDEAINAKGDLRVQLGNEKQAKVNAERANEQLQRETEGQKRENASLQSRLEETAKARNESDDRVREVEYKCRRLEQDLECVNPAKERAMKDAKKSKEDCEAAKRQRDAFHEELYEIKAGNIIISPPTQPQTSVAPQAPVERSLATSKSAPTVTAKGNKPTSRTPSIFDSLNTKPPVNVSSIFKTPRTKSTDKPASTPTPKHAKPTESTPSIFASLNTNPPGNQPSGFKFPSITPNRSSPPKSTSDGSNTTGSPPPIFPFSNIKAPGKTSPVFKFPDTIPTSTATPAIDFADTGKLFTFTHTRPVDDARSVSTAFQSQSVSSPLRPAVESPSASVQSEGETESPVPAPFADSGIQDAASPPSSTSHAAATLSLPSPQQSKDTSIGNGRETSGSRVVENQTNAWYDSLNKEEQAREDDAILGLGEEMEEGPVEKDTDMPTVVPAVLPPPAVMPPVLPPPAAMPPVFPPSAIPPTVVNSERGVGQSDAMDVEIPAPGGGREQSVQNAVGAPVLQAPAAFTPMDWTSFSAAPLTTGIPGLGQFTQTPQPASFLSLAAPPASLPTAASSLSAGTGASATLSSPLPGTPTYRPEQMDQMEDMAEKMEQRMAEKMEQRKAEKTERRMMRKAPVNDEDACLVKPKSRKKPTPKSEAKPAPTDPAPSQAQSSQPSTTTSTPFQASATNPADTDAMDFAFTPAPPRPTIEMMDVDDARKMMSSQEEAREAARAAARDGREMDWTQG